MLRAAMFMTALVGCSGVEVFPRQASPDEMFQNYWHGRHQDEVLFKYGSPQDTAELSTGNKVISYHREGFVGHGGATTIGRVGASSSSATTFFCDRRFEIERTTLIVVRASTAGTGCY